MLSLMITLEAQASPRVQQGENGDPPSPDSVMDMQFGDQEEREQQRAEQAAARSKGRREENPPMAVAAVC
jgi:hypothetical protein